MDLSTQRKTEEIKKSLNEIIDNYDKVKPYYAFSYKVLSFDTLCLTLSYKVNGLANKLYNCLLYTSPSPRDRTRSRMPSSA